MQSTYDRIQYYTMDKSRKEAVAKKLKALLADKSVVKLAWIFGSITRHDKVRDVDVAIHAEPRLSFAEYLDLNAYIEMQLHLPVDLVEIEDVPNLLKQKIFCEGILIKGTRTLQKQLQNAKD